MNEVILRELGGGPNAVIVLLLLSGLGAMTLVVRTLWIRLNQERDKNSDLQGTCSKDLRELHLSTLKTLHDVDKTVSSLASALRERHRGDDR